MSNDNCKTCIFGDKCHTTVECDFYAPLDDDWCDINDYIEKKWLEYLDAWNQYTAGW